MNIEPSGSRTPKIVRKEKIMKIVKKFTTYILVAILAVTGAWGLSPTEDIQGQTTAANILDQVSPNNDWDPAPGYIFDFELNRTVYSPKDIIRLELPDYILEMESPIVDIIQEDTGSTVFFRKAEESPFIIDIDLHPGEYLLRVRQDKGWIGWDASWGTSRDVVYASARFSVVGTSDLLQLTGKAVADGNLDYPESCMLIGVRLEWDGSSDGGTYTLTRIDEGFWNQEVIQVENIQTNHFFDTGALPGGVYTYTVSDGKKTSNPIVFDLSKFPPLEYIGNKNDKVIVLRISDPYIYTAVDSVSASKLSELTIIRPIDENNLGVVPVISNGRTLVPIATLVRTMSPGSGVVWDGDRQLVTIKIWGNVLEIPIGSKTVYVNNQARTFDTPARIEHGRTLVPVRHLELLGCEVDWIDTSRSVLICYQDG